jgi:MYXO-CTERM domain-containing protein
MKAIAKRLDAHFAACAAAAAGVAMVGQSADAAIVHSGIINLTINNDTNGLYLNIATGAYNTTGGGGTTVPGWDVNPYGGGTVLNFWNAATPTGGTYVRGGGATGTTIANLAPDTLIGAGISSGAAAFNTLTWSSTQGAAHTAPGQNLGFVFSSNQNIVGFRFFKEGDPVGSVHYGWMRIALGSAVSQPRQLVEYAYESEIGVGIGAGQVPAPGALALLGLAGVVGTRRRRHN